MDKNEIMHFTRIGDNSGTENAYGWTWAELVQAYLKEGYASEATNVDVESLGKKYHVLKRGEVTAFYDEAGNTLFDVENARLQEEYEFLLKGAEEGSEDNEDDDRPFEHETIPMGTASLADIVTGNVPAPTPEEIAEAEKQLEEAEDDEPEGEEEEESEQMDDPADEVVEEADGDEAQEVPAESGEAEKEDPAPAAVGIDGAVQKLQKELNASEDPQMRKLLNHMIERCQESESLSQDVCQSHKTWEKCWDYVLSQAKKRISGRTSEGTYAFLGDEDIYEWAEDYFHKDDKAEEEDARKEAEKKAKQKEKSPEQEKLEKRNKAAQMKAKQKAESNPVVKEEPKKTAAPKPATAPKEKPQKKSNEMDGQMDLFSMLGM